MADGETIDVGHGIRIVTDTVADIGISTVEAAGVIVELISVNVSITEPDTATEEMTFTLADAGGTLEVLQQFAISKSAPLSIQYPPGSRPRLSGMRIDSEVVSTGAVMSYSIMYRVVSSSASV